MTSTADSTYRPLPFTPTIEVLTAAPANPTPPDMSFDAVMGRFPGLADAEAVCWTGSTAVGWGNALSDVDLYAFADQDLNLPPDDSSEAWTRTDMSGVTWHNWVGRYGDVCVDLETWRTATVKQVLEPYLAEGGPEFCRLNDTMQDFLYRVSIAVPLKNKDYFDREKEIIRRSTYAQSLARIRKAEAELYLIDVAGQLKSGDTMTARLTATLAAYAVADQCLILAGDLCRREKWLMRRLESTPACGIGVNEYRATVLEGARDGESDADVAERVARWAQAHLVRVEDAVLNSRRSFE
jgi:hypothetical protein